ncbi:hypothetical protein B0T09DRAFT_344531 [Sordaria sp. MPI-SDFR-AT-0083]|nr:hypothetical protein B0T09DRAFT_344531 [Sordaria sp. MPI-SDFR-AT-0083]
MRNSIVDFLEIDEMNMQDVQKQCEILGGKIGRFVRLFSRRLKEHVESLEGGEMDWWVVHAAVECVISVIELVYYDAVSHMDRNPDVNWTSLEVLGHLIRHGVKEGWGGTRSSCSLKPESAEGEWCNGSGASPTCSKG